MPAQEKLSQHERILAYVAGSGIVLIMIALFLYALDVVDDTYPLSLLIVGLALLVVGIIAWLYVMRPWQKFDDLQTPHYTGHDEAHAKPAEAASEAEAETQIAQVPAAQAAKIAPAAKAVEPAPAAQVAEPVPVAKIDAPKAVADVDEPPVEAKAAPAAPAKPSEPDDLTLIEGIGPKSAAALQESNVTHFAQMAQMAPDELERIVKAKKVRLVGSTETWPMQARLAAAGEFSELEALQKRIIRGYLHDDLTLIEGVGPKAQEALWKAGFRTFADVAKASADALKEALDKAGLKLLDPTTWPQQAQLVVNDDLSALKALQDKLRGGRA